MPGTLPRPSPCYYDGAATGVGARDERSAGSNVRLGHQSLSLLHDPLRERHSGHGPRGQGRPKHGDGKWGAGRGAGERRGERATKGSVAGEARRDCVWCATRSGWRRRGGSWRRLGQRGCKWAYREVLHRYEYGQETGQSGSQPRGLRGRQLARGLHLKVAPAPFSLRGYLQETKNEDLVVKQPPT